jgi:hypothetical protein
MCALPKNYRKNVNIIPEKYGMEQVDELLSQQKNDGTYLPKPVLYEDLDASFIEFINKDLEIIIDGEKIPVIFLTLQRWAEFSRTWEFTDKHKDIKMPFITIVRKPDIQPGTEQQSLWNTAARLTYTYYKVPTFDGIRKGIDVYKVPQPTAVDIKYEVRMFCNRMRDLNLIQLKVHQAFRSRQFYISPNGHPMPIIVDNFGDESPVSDFENRRFYTQLFEMRLQGYILDSNEFEVVPLKNRALVITELQPTGKNPILRIKTDNTTSLITFNLIFKPLAPTIFKTTSKFDTKFTEIVNMTNITSIIISVNNNVVTIPFTVVTGDIIEFKITKPRQLDGILTLNGNLL